MDDFLEGSFYPGLQSKSCDLSQAPRAWALRAQHILHTPLSGPSCDAGYWCEASSTSKTQNPCPAGSKCVAGAHSPEVCAAGKSNNVVKLGCDWNEVCAAGRWSVMSVVRGQV